MEQVPSRVLLVIRGLSVIILTAILEMRVEIVKAMMIATIGVKKMAMKNVIVI